MAPTNTETLDSLYTSTWQIVKKQVTDTIFTATPFFYEMYKGENIEREDGGRFIEEPLMYGKNGTVGWIDKGGTISIADTDPLTTSIWNWRNIAGSIVRMWADDMSNSGPHKKIDLMNAKIENLRLTIIDTLETQLFTAQSGSTMSGLPDMVQAAVPASQSTSPGGLSKATYDWWRNQYFAATGSFAAYGKSDMRTMYNNCSIGNDHPNLILTEQTVFEFYEAEAEDIQRINDSAIAELGFTSFKYKGATMYYSPQCPTGYMYFLNLKYLKLKIDSKADFDMTEFKTIPNQLDRVAQVVSRMELVSRNNRMQGLIGGITTA
jgi:hypothetical protein